MASLLHCLRFVLVCALLPLLVQRARAATDRAWTTPVPPFKIADGLYYVGSQDLAAYLITTPQGNILLNANYIRSPPQIRHSVEALGFRWRDLRVLLISHAHVDHAGGAAEIVRETGAKLEVMEGDVDVIESGGATDFAFGGAKRGLQFPPVHVARALHDGEAVTLGGTTLVAHLTPGHTKGTTTWTLSVHVPGEPAAQRRQVVIVGSWSVLDNYRLVASHGRPPSYPGITKDYEKTFAVLRALPCDIFLASHGQIFAMPAKAIRMATAGDEVWIDPGGYQRALQQAQAEFEKILQRQQAIAARQPDYSHRS